MNVFSQELLTKMAQNSNKMQQMNLLFEKLEQKVSTPQEDKENISTNLLSIQKVEDIVKSLSQLKQDQETDRDFKSNVYKVINAIKTDFNIKSQEFLTRSTIQDIEQHLNRHNQAIDDFQKQADVLLKQMSADKDTIKGLKSIQVDMDSKYLDADR